MTGNQWSEDTLEEPSSTFLSNVNVSGAGYNIFNDDNWDLRSFFHNQSIVDQNELNISSLEDARQSAYAEQNSTNNRVVDERNYTELDLYQAGPTRERHAETGPTYGGIGNWGNPPNVNSSENDRSNDLENAEKVAGFGQDAGVTSAQVPTMRAQNSANNRIQERTFPSSRTRGHAPIPRPPYVPDIFELLNQAQATTKTHFSSLEEANDAMRTKVACPTDDTIPQSPLQKVAIVKALCEAMLSTQYAQDNPGMIRKFQAGKYDMRRVEAKCWDILECTIDRQTWGPFISPKRKESPGMETFASRITAVLESLIHQKTICKHLLDEKYVHTFVDDPKFAQKRVVANKLLNKKKGEVMNAGKQFMGVQAFNAINGKRRAQQKTLSIGTANNTASNMATGTVNPTLAPNPPDSKPVVSYQANNQSTTNSPADIRLPSEGPAGFDQVGMGPVITNVARTTLAVQGPSTTVASHQNSVEITTGHMQANVNQPVNQPVNLSTISRGMIPRHEGNAVYSTRQGHGNPPGYIRPAVYPYREPEGQYGMMGPYQQNGISSGTARASLNGHPSTEGQYSFSQRPINYQQNEFETPSSHAYQPDMAFTQPMTYQRRTPFAAPAPMISNSGPSHRYRSVFDNVPRTFPRQFPMSNNQQPIMVPNVAGRPLSGNGRGSSAYPSTGIATGSYGGGYIEEQQPTHITYQTQLKPDGRKRPASDLDGPSYNPPEKRKR